MGQLILVESFFEAKDAIVEQPVPYSANSNETSAMGSRIYSKFVHRTTGPAPSRREHLCGQVKFGLFEERASSTCCHSHERKKSTLLFFNHSQVYILLRRTTTTTTTTVAS